MTDLREAAQQALEALKAMQSYAAAERKGLRICDESIAALKQALAEPEQPYDQTALDLCKVCGWRTLIPGDACLYCERSKQPEQEPVAWMHPSHGYMQRRTKDMESTVVAAYGRNGWIPLYTAPTPQREHITDGSPCWCNPDVIEEDGGNVIVHNYDDNWQQYAKPGETAQQCIERHRSEQDALMKLYATPQRRPLTDKEIDVLEQRVWSQTVDKGKTQGEYAMKFARAIERAHGIGEQHE